jgi:hypothetical protein
VWASSTKTTCARQLTCTVSKVSSVTSDVSINCGNRSQAGIYVLFAKPWFSSTLISFIDK